MERGSITWFSRLWINSFDLKPLLTTRATLSSGHWRVHAAAEADLQVEHSARRPQAGASLAGATCSGYRPIVSDDQPVQARVHQVNNNNNYKFWVHQSQKTFENWASSPDGWWINQLQKSKLQISDKMIIPEVPAWGGDWDHRQQGPADHVHVLLGRLRLSALPDNLHHAGDWLLTINQGEGGRNFFWYCIHG